jgi:hypothetical protein
MNSSILSNHRPWWQPGPLNWTALEMLFMRAGFAALVFYTIKWETGAWTTQKFPNGIAHFVDLTWIGQNPPGPVWQGVTIAGLAAYVAGWLPALGLLPALFFSIVIGTLGNSQGAINHSTQMVTMMLLAQFLVYLLPRGAGVEKPASHWLQPGTTTQQRVIWWSTVVIAASYVVCGVVKLTNSNFMWLNDSPYLAVQLMKTNWSHYHDTLEMPPDWLQTVTQTLVDYPNLARLFFGSGLLIELLGFVVLINRRWALAGGLAIIALHLSISQVMSLNFQTHILAALIFLVNVPGWFLHPKRPA